jgi:hypothetical protein
MNPRNFISYLPIGLLLLSLFCGTLSLAFGSNDFDIWILAILESIASAGLLFYTCRFEEWRFRSLVLPAIVLIGFSFCSPVRPFLSFFVSLAPGMTPVQVRTSLNHNFPAKSGFFLPREDPLRLSDEEQTAGISSILYVVDPSDGTINCDTIDIKFDRNSKLVAARYSSPIIPSR